MATEKLKDIKQKQKKLLQTHEYLLVIKFGSFESCTESFLNPVSESSEVIFWRCLVKRQRVEDSQRHSAVQNPLLRQCERCL